MSAGFSGHDPQIRRETGGAGAAGLERDEVDLGGVSAALARRKALILGTTAFAALAALGFCMVVKPRYLAEARVIVEDQESYFTRADPTARETPQLPDAEAINSQIQLVSSRDLARQAVADLKLRENPEFDPTAHGLLAPLALLGFGDISPKALDDRLLTTYFDHLTVMSPTKSRILQIEFSARDPDLAALAANKIAELYIETKQQAKRDTAREAAQSLKPLIAELEKRVAEADAKVAAFRVANGLYESTQNTNLSTQQLGELATKLADARAAESEASSKARALRDLLSRGRLGDAGEISSNDLVRTVAGRRSMIKAQLAAESQTLLPGHPRIKELQGQLSDIETQLRSAVEKAARGLDNDARVASARVANLTSLLDEQKKVVGAANGQQAQLLEMQRQAKTLKDQLDSESAKYQAAMARGQSESTPADARLVSRALSPSLPVFPKKVPITIFATLAGLFFTSFYVIAGEISGRPGAPAPMPTPTPSADDSGFGRKWARAPAPAGGKIGAVAGATLSGVGAQAPGAPAEEEKSTFGKLKAFVAHFGAPAIPLDDPAPESPAGTTPPERRFAESAPIETGRDIWVRDPFAAAVPPAPKAEQDRDAHIRDIQVGAAQVGAAQILDEPARSTAPRAAPQVSSDLINRIVAAGDGHGAVTLLVETDIGATLPYSLVTARALARMGRAILVQACPGRHLDTVMATGQAQPGVAQLLAGEASFAEAIFRDGESRLHLLTHGGPLEADAEDLRTVVDALRATYDFVLIVARADALGLELAQEADLTLILGAPSPNRDHSHDDFAAAGARQLILAAPAASGELTEGAA